MEATVTLEEIPENNKKKKRGATRHCCYGLCNSDSRYSERDYMQNVFWIIFPKPHRDLEKCKRWARACGRVDFTENKVNKWTYICSKHFVGGNGPTPEFPDPVPATFTPIQTEKLKRKRKPPTPRAEPISKRALLEGAEALLSLQDYIPPPVSSDNESATQPLTNMAHGQPQTHGVQHHETQSVTDTEVKKEFGVNTDPIMTSDRESQTTYACKDTLAAKIGNVINRNSAEQTNTQENDLSTFCFEILCKNENNFKFYTGLTVAQFEHLFNCLGETVNTLIYWRGKRTNEENPVPTRRPTEMKVTPKNQLLLTLMKLRQAFPNKDLAYRFKISESTVSTIIITWVQFLFKQTEGLRRRMFPSQELIKEHLPRCFSSFKNVRVIIDCFEIRTQSSRNFEEQGNMYSSYKNNTTLKCLVGISPSGGVSFLSDTYEGSISDKQIVIRSGLVNLLQPGDLVIADRGFLIKDILQEHKVDLNIPPFLGKRDRLTAQEEIQTKRIARVRIHVERAIERMKKFKILSRVVPLSLKPVISQIVHVIGFLVNYQEPLVK